MDKNLFPMLAVEVAKEYTDRVMVVVKECAKFSMKKREGHIRTVQAIFASDDNFLLATTTIVTIFKGNFFWRTTKQEIDNNFQPLSVDEALELYKTFTNESV